MICHARRPRHAVDILVPCDGRRRTSLQAEGDVLLRRADHRPRLPGRAVAKAAAGVDELRDVAVGRVGRLAADTDRRRSKSSVG